MTANDKTTAGAESAAAIPQIIGRPQTPGQSVPRISLMVNVDAPRRRASTSW
jgi:hypothetical protein